jgi:hypothetical protein
VLEACSFLRSLILKIGIPLLVVGVLLLVLSIPFSVVMIVAGVGQLSSGAFASRLLAWAPLAGVIIGFVMVTIGASRVFKN